MINHDYIRFCQGDHKLYQNLLVCYRCTCRGYEAVIEWHDRCCVTIKQTYTHDRVRAQAAIESYIDDRLAGDKFDMAERMRRA